MSYAAAPRLTTDRLVLHPPRPEDIDDSIGLWGDGAVMRFIGDGRPLGAEEVWSRLLRQVGGWEWCGFGYWTVRARQDGGYVGTVGFQDARRIMDPALPDAPEIGWLLTPTAQGRGLAREAVAAALAWADAHLDAVETTCIIRPTHARSIRVATALGYARRGTALYHGHPIDVFIRPKGFQSAAVIPTS